LALALALVAPATASILEPEKTFRVTVNPTMNLTHAVFMYAAHPLPDYNATYEIRCMNLPDQYFIGGEEHTFEFTMFVPDLPSFYSFTYGLAAIYDDANNGVAVGTSAESAASWVADGKAFTDLFNEQEDLAAYYVRNAADNFDYFMFRTFEDHRYAADTLPGGLVSFSTAADIGTWHVFETVPEPASMIALGVGALGLALKRRRK